MGLLVVLLLGCAVGAVLAGHWLEALGTLGMVAAVLCWPRDWRRPVRYRGRWWEDPDGR